MPLGDANGNQRIKGMRMAKWVIRGLRTIFLVAVSPLTSSAGDWGTVRGRFVLDGPAPERPVLQINKDVEFCGKHSPRTERLIVDAKDRGIANVVVWLDVKAGEKPPIHESLLKDVPEQVRLSNKGCRFDPHICIVRTGQRLLIENKDTIDHNTAAGFDRNNPFNELTPAGKSSERPKLMQAEKLPAQVQCSIHPWMLGWLVVKDHPYVAVSDAHGRFELKNLPAGEQTLVVWHEAAELVTEGTRGGEKQTWKRGKISVKVEASESDWGEVSLSPDLFK